jgi:biopolymer transport protein ExbB
MKTWRITIMVAIVALAWLGAFSAGAQQDGAGDAPGDVVVKIQGEAPTSLVDLLNRGGPLMYPLYLCSIAVVAFAIERAVRLRRAAILPPDIVAKIRLDATGAHRLNQQDLLRELKHSNSPIARVITAGLRAANRPLAELEQAIEDAGQREADNLRRGCRVLSIISNISPLLGLLGTVVGMIKSFMTVAAREEALGRTELLAEGIYQALITTAAGLCIAIPALVLYYIFTEKVDHLVSEMDMISIDLVETLKIRGDAA